jgi:multimeric flavodoxin WrbA
MKVMAINSSPHMDEGNTAVILGLFTEGERHGRSPSRYI